MGRAPCCDKANVKRGPWSPDEDATLKNYLLKFGTGGNWISLPHRAGLKRCGKSCRLRWLNYLRPNIKHGAFTDEEDNIIISLYSKMGSRWSVIAANLPGRTDNDVKNHWNTKLKKKLFGGPKNNSKFINSSTTPKSTNVTSPIIQIHDSSSTSSNYMDNNHNYDINLNKDQNHQQFYVPISNFSSLLTQCTSTPMSSMPNFSNSSNLEYYPYVYNPVLSPSSNGYSIQQAQVKFQPDLPYIDNGKVCLHDETSSISELSTSVYGSSLEDDPFLAEQGFGLLQEVLLSPTSSYGDQFDIKPQGLGQNVTNY